MRATADRETMLAEIRQNPSWDTLYCNRTDIPTDRIFLLVLVAINYDMAFWTLEYFAGDTLKGDREFIMALMAYDFDMALGFASKEMKREVRTDRETVLAVIRPEEDLPLSALEHYADDTLRENGDFIFKLATFDLDIALEYASEEMRRELRTDREMALTAFRQDEDPTNSTLDNCADDALKGDRECILALAAIDGYMALKYASEELRRKIIFLLIAFRQDPANEKKRPRISFGIGNNRWIYGIGIC